MRSRLPLATSLIVAIVAALFVASPVHAAHTGPHAAASPIVTSTPPTIPTSSTRLSGTDRYLTAVAASQRFAAGVSTVYVASGQNFPDALSAAAAASHLGGPLLLTKGASIPTAVLNEVQRLSPQRVVVVGGSSVVTDGVLAKLRSVVPNTIRVAGSTRYETGLRVVADAFTNADHAILASGRAFPDALSATGAAGARNAPVFLVDGRLPALPTALLSQLRALGVTSVALAGSASVVPAAFEQQLRNAGISVARYGGADRFETSALIAGAYFPQGSSTTFLAGGLNFPDALAGAALAGNVDAPLLITRVECVPESVKNAAEALGSTTTITMGGTSVVSAEAAANVGCLQAAAPSITATAIRVGRTASAVTNGWSADTSFSYQWLANGAAIAGATSSTLVLTTAQQGKTISVRVTGSLAGFRSVTATSARTAPVAAAPLPTNSKPIAMYTCPSWAPIKGNADSMIYHVPGGSFYNRTHPEICFRTERDALNAGYRKSRV